MRWGRSPADTLSSCVRTDRTGSIGQGVEGNRRKVNSHKPASEHALGFQEEARLRAVEAPALPAERTGPLAGTLLGDNFPVGMEAVAGTGLRKHPGPVAAGTVA